MEFHGKLRGSGRYEQRFVGNGEGKGKSSTKQKYLSGVGVGGRTKSALTGDLGGNEQFPAASG